MPATEKALLDDFDLSSLDIHLMRCNSSGCLRKIQVRAVTVALPIYISSLFTKTKSLQNCQLHYHQGPGHPDILSLKLQIMTILFHQKNNINFSFSDF